MKKKDVIISIIIACVLSFVMIFFSLFKKDNVIIEKSSAGDTKISEKSKDNLNEEIIVKSADENENVIVYVTGAVKSPQVVEMKNGDRLIDAVEKCGGMTKEADTNAVNLALLLKDEGHYIIPKIGEIVQTTAINNNANSGNINNTSVLININTADKSKLMELPTVGEKTADRIIEYRSSNGQFNSIEDLKNISGIGDKKFEQMRDFVTVN